MKQSVFMTCVYFCQKPPQSIATRFQFQQRYASSIAEEIRLATQKIHCFAGYITCPPPSTVLCMAVCFTSCFSFYQKRLVAVPSYCLPLRQIN